MALVRRIAARLPNEWQTELKRIYFRRQIRQDRFTTEEPEFAILSSLIHAGDWVVDIGANVGHYTKRFSELVGPRGRVIAFEPVPTTFSLLSANSQLFAHANVSLINAAVSDKLDVVGMAMPKFPTGLTNYYEAHVSPATESSLAVLTVSLDSLCVGQPIALVKIDAEGHEAFVLSGMRKVIAASRPILLVETGSDKVIADLSSLGYTPEKFPNSPNVLFRPNVLS